MYKVITNENLQYIKNHPEMTDSEIGSNLGINKNTIRSARHKLGIYKNKTISITEDEFLRAYSRNNKKLYLMAEELNVDRHTLREVAKKYGIKTDRSVNLSEEDISNICASYAITTSKELAEKYNCSPSKILQIWAQHGLRGKTNRIYNLNEAYFDKIDTPAKAYYVGLIASDGCLYNANIANKNPIVKIAISSNDDKVLKLLQKELASDKPINYICRNERCYASLEICSNNIYNSLIRIGFPTARKTYGNTIPEITDNLMPHFIRGYFDGDGSVPNSWGDLGDSSKLKPSASISGYKRNMVKLIDYLSSKNIFASFLVDKRVYNGDDEFGTLSLSNLTSVYCFLKLIYNNCGEHYIDRKKLLADNVIKYIENNDKIRYKQIVKYYEYAVQVMC